MLETIYVDYSLANICYNCYYQGVIFCYTYLGALVFDSVTLATNSLPYLIQSNNSDVYLAIECLVKSLWQESLTTLVEAQLTDLYVLNSLYEAVSSEFRTSNTLNPIVSSLYLSYNYDYIIFFKNACQSQFLDLLINQTLVLVNSNIYENYVIFFKLSLFFFELLFFFIFFISMYLSIYTSLFGDDNSNDFSNLLTSLLFEAEKEIGSIDDIILCLFIVFYLFFWYFYTNFVLVLFSLPELSGFFFCLPLLYFVIILMPTILLSDFGLYFLVYLKGSCASSLLVCELIFDYIAVCVFYTRLVVQGVRLVLMIATYIGLNDVILYFSYDINYLSGFDDLQYLNNTKFENLSLYLVTVVPGKIIYWLYELFHTFFVVTVQFGAFFAMVFWLFLFLYTFFVSEKFENFFKLKRN